MSNPINYWYQKYQSLKAEMDKMMKGAVEVAVWDAGVDFAPHPVISVEDFNVKDGDKVRVIVCKKED